MKILEIKSELGEVEKVRRFLSESLKGIRLSEKALYIIELSLEEICVNIIRYAYPHRKGKIFFKFWRQSKKIFIEVRDNGIPFDPRESRTPDLKEVIRKRKKGGLGIFLARKLMDGFEYKRENEQNILTLYKKISGSASPQSEESFL